MGHLLLRFPGAFLLSVALLSPAAWADNRALLVGLAHYQHPAAFQPAMQSLDLPPATEDLKRVKNLLNQLGFAEGNIRVLQDDWATEKNIVLSLQKWLPQGVTPEDKVVIYFSGHGSYVWDESGDEDDQRDEVFLAYDAHFEGNVLRGRILDDDIPDLIKAIRSQHLLFIVDACYSGNFNKGVFISDASDGYTQGKFVDNPHFYPRSNSRLPPPQANPPMAGTKGLEVFKRLRDFFEFDVTQPYQPGQVFFTAAAENQRTFVNDQGSMFTRLFTQLAQNQLTKVPLTYQPRLNLRQLQEDTRRRFAAELSDNPPSPQLFGDPRAIEQGF